MCLSALILHFRKAFIDRSIGGMDLKLSIAAVIAQIGHKHVILEEIGNDTQALVEHHITVDIAVHHMLSEATQADLSH